MSALNRHSPVTALNGVGEAQAKRFGAVGVKTVDDLIHYYPRRYDDYSAITSIAKLRPGTVTIRAVIKQVSGRSVRRGMFVTEAVASDTSGSVKLVWFNQPYRAKSIKANTEYFISGQYELRRQRFTITNPAMELVSELPLNTARILAVYRETKGLSSWQIRRAVEAAQSVVAGLPDTLPSWTLKQHKLMPLASALATIHAPASSDELLEAQRRLGFDEVFGLSLASLLNKQSNRHEKSIGIKFDQQLARSFVTQLPFKLTDDQRRAAWQIYQDLQQTSPMNRLVEGDVGSGKTVVAAMAALMVMAAKCQVALMAPTELLARQHAETIHKLLDPLGMSDRVVLLVGSMTAKQKQQARQAIENGTAGFMIGTQALIQEKVDMHKLALVIIDEQHRFGVEQRKTLMSKAGHMPHVLSLTATPIPRSLALTLYGELDISLLKSKPSGRQPVITELVASNSRAQLFRTIDAQIEAGRQVYVVCPLITDSEVVEASSAEAVYDELSRQHFKHRRIELLHGRLKADQKQRVMQRFVGHEIDVLVATTVIEVGVDVPNASVMLIEGAERFGLAQLHQLRGRIGRGSDQGYCYLLMSPGQPPSRRLRALEQSSDGFKLAELDLELRGPGAIYGTMQHGQLDLRVAKLGDSQLIAAARSAADEFIRRNENLLQYEQLATRVGRLRAVTNLN